MKRILPVFLAVAMLCTSTGCAAPAKDYAVARASYPVLTDYTEEYETLTQYEQSGTATMEQLDKAYTDLQVAMTAHHAELQALHEEAANNAPDLTRFTAQTTDALFRGRAENTVYSPVNLYLALAMLAESTDGDTRKEVTDLMGTSDTRSAANALWKLLYNDGRGKTLAANSMWTGETYPVKQSLADTLANHYYADTFTVPMGTPEADKAMQNWLNTHTEHQLEDAVGGIQSSPDTVLSLMSTLYFEYMWTSKFQEAVTAPDTFTTPEGTEVTADFMHDAHTGAWYQGDDYVMASRSFQDQGGRMIFILPDDGILPEQLLTDKDTLMEILTAEHDQYTRIEWSVPKFDVSSNLELSKHLQTLGIEKVFDPNHADFTPATEAVQLALSQVQHAGRVTIDENGCSAAAFTVMMMNTASRPPDEILHMNLNRPFAFLIVNDSNLPLFIGTVYAP